MQRLLRGLRTFAEAERFANRWKAARLLLEGKTQSDTARELRLSSKTVHAVSWFVDGLESTGGFADVHRRLRQGDLEQQVGGTHDQIGTDDADNQP